MNTDNGPGPTPCNKHGRAVGSRGAPVQPNCYLLQGDLDATREGRVMQFDRCRRRTRRDLEDDLAAQRVAGVDLLVERVRVLEVDRRLGIGGELLPLGVQQLRVVTEESLRRVADVGDVQTDDT